MQFSPIKGSSLETSYSVTQHDIYPHRGIEDSDIEVDTDAETEAGAEFDGVDEPGDGFWAHIVILHRW